MNILKKTLVFFLTLLMSIILFSACSSVVIDTERYQVTRKGEKYYFTFKDPEAITKLDHYEDGEAELYRVSFDSLEDLLSTFRTGTFSDKECYTIFYLNWLDDANNEIFDIENLVEPVVPSPSAYKYVEIHWRNNVLVYLGSFDDDFGIVGCDFLSNHETNLLICWRNGNATPMVRHGI